MKKYVLALVVCGLAPSAFAFSGSVPHCLSQNGKVLPVDNAGALRQAQSTPNQFKTEAHVQGLISDIYPDHNGHTHFAIMYPGTKVGIEVVYNQVFGKLPLMRVGMQVEACGEFINSKAATSQYPASPMGAIIHWVHINPNQGADKHASGFLVINNQVYGQNASGADHGHQNKHFTSVE